LLNEFTVELFSAEPQSDPFSGLSPQFRHIIEVIHGLFNENGILFLVFSKKTDLFVGSPDDVIVRASRFMRDGHYSSRHQLYNCDTKMLISHGMYRNLGLLKDFYYFIA
jgi:hypothetical protein